MNFFAIIWAKITNFMIKGDFLKYIYILFLFGILNAQIIDGIALKVNGNIVTMFEIENLQKSLRISKDEAIRHIIIDKLRENEIKRLKINVDERRLDDEINNIAMSNRLTREQLLSALKEQGMDMESYRKELKNHLVNRDLMQRILQSSSNIASEDELRRYYNANKKEFSFPNKIKVTSYTSLNEAALQAFLNNPMLLNNDVVSKDEELSLHNLPPQIANVFLSTPERSFTPVLNSGNALIVFFVKEKIGSELAEFDNIKTIVMQKYAQTKENEILNEYFEKIKANSKIEILR